MQIMRAPQQNQPEIVLGLENHYKRLLSSLYQKNSGDLPKLIVAIIKIASTLADLILTSTSADLILAPDINTKSYHLNSHIML